MWSTLLSYVVLERELCDLLEEANRLSDNVIFTGDLNSDILHPLDNHKVGQCLLDMCDIYDLDSLINVPTGISKNRESCLDVILTNVPAFAKDSGVIHTGLSDHDLVYTVLKTRNMRSKAETITKRSFKTFHKDSTVPFSVSYVFDYLTMYIGVGINSTIKFWMLMHPR